MKYAKFTFNPFQENTFIIWDDSKECLIIDPGCYYPNEFEELDAFVTKENLVPKGILNTHCHIDHVLGVSQLMEQYDIPFIIHEKEQVNLDRLSMQAQMFGLPLRHATPEADQLISEGDAMAFGNTELAVLFVPGHSPGHLAFHHKDSSLLIGGDVLFRNSIGRTDLPGCNASDLISSIKTKLYTLPENTTVLPGHMENTTIGYEMKNNPFVKA